MAEFAPGMRMLIRDEEWMIRKGTDGQGRPLKYGNITGETSTTVDVAFDSGYSSQFPKDMFDSGMLVIVGNY